MGNFKLRVVFCLTIITGITGIGHSFAQEIPEIEIFSEINGDFQQIKGVQQDELGNLWVASDAHIEKFNHHQSEFFNNFKGLPKGTGEINTIFIDSKDRIWIGTATGLIKYDPVKDFFVQIGSQDYTPNINQLLEDEKGILWIGATNGIWKYQEEALFLSAKFPVEESVNDLLAVGNELVFGTATGLFVLNKKSGAYKMINFSQQLDILSLEYSGDFYLIGTREDGLYRSYPDFTSLEKIYSLPYSSNRIPITGISQDMAGNFYIATKGDGLYGLDKNLKFIEHYLADDNSLSLADNHLVGLYLDKFNNLYVSTETGQINSLSLRENIFMFLKHDPAKFGSLADNFTTAIEKDQGGKVWFGTRQGLSIWNPANNSWKHMKNLSFSKQSSVPDVIKDLKSDGIHMWVATYNDGVYKVNTETLLRAHYSVDSRVKTELQRVNAILVDSSKNLWVGGADGDLTQITSSGQIKTFSLRGINAMKELARGDMLLGGKNGVFRIKKGRNDISRIAKLDPSPEDLPYFTINSISETSNGDIILATEGAGIIIYNSKNDSYWKMDRNSGLPSNRIRGLIVYENDDIWAGTSKGLVNFRANKEQPLIRIFDKDDGLLSNIFTRGSFARLDNKLAFGTFKGVSLFDPENLKNLPDDAPNVIIGSVNINSRKKGSKILGSVDMQQELELDHHENTLEFGFYGLQPGKSNPQLSYSWKLEGLEAGWSVPSTQTRVIYANLPPGSYNFIVKARTNNGNWSDVTAVAVHIGAPWWISAPGYLLYATLSFLLLFFIIRIRRKASQKTEEESLKTLKHEIGTPLSILITTLDNLSDEVEQKNKHRLKNIVTRLGTLLEPLLISKSLISPKTADPKTERIVMDPNQNQWKDSETVEYEHPQSNMQAAPASLQPELQGWKTPDTEIRILIVGDNDELRKVYMGSLRKLGKVYHASSGKEALQVANGLSPHIIVADLDMPPDDALAWTKALRNNPWLFEVPVYLMVSDEEKFDLPHRTYGNFLIIIKKPVHIEALYEIISERLEKISVPFRNSSLSRRNSEILKGGKQDFATKLEKCIIANIPKGSLTAEEISAAMGVTPTRLHLRLKSEYKVSLDDFILSTKLNYAKNLISKGVSAPEEVYRQAGFHNKDTFYLAFRKHFGVIPGIIEK